MSNLNSICVYCGSNIGVNPHYTKAAELIGRDIANCNIKLIYGGGSIGLMGVVAKSVMENGGMVTGIIPGFLKDKEIMLKEVTEHIVTKDMHERKRIMFEKADAFVALPGGIGTLEELVEMLTWSQLGQHMKPILLANIDNFWNPLLELLDHMIMEKFIRVKFKDLYLIEDRPEQIVKRLQEHQAKISKGEDVTIESATKLDLL